jgi:DNA repair exonuclease SbcCD ATPase subunit
VEEVKRKSKEEIAKRIINIKAQHLKDCKKRADEITKKFAEDRKIWISDIKNENSEEVKNLTSKYENAIENLKEELFDARNKLDETQKNLEKVKTEITLKEQYNKDLNKRILDVQNDLALVISLRLV